MHTILALGAFSAYAMPLLGQAQTRFQDRLTHVGWALAGVGLHMASLASAVAEAGRVPLDSMDFGLSSLSLWVVLGWLYLHRRPRMELLSSLVLGLGVFLLGLAELAPSAPGGESALDSAWFPIHVTLMLMGLTGFALSFTLSALFLVVRRRLKARDLRGIARLPSLESLDRMNYRSMALGFCALTAGMAVGGMWAAHKGEGMGPDATIYVTVAMWIWYAAGLHVRLVAGWRGRLAALFGVGGFAGLVVLVGVALLFLQGWHGGNG